MVTNPNDPLYLGAPLKTVNTGELTALTWALEEIARRPRVAGGIHSVLSDSTYALGRALSSDKPRANKKSVVRTRAALRKARIKHGYRGVPLAHIRAHVGWYGNAYADRLAKKGLMAWTMWENGKNSHCFLENLRKGQVGEGVT